MEAVDSNMKQVEEKKEESDKLFFHCIPYLRFYGFLLLAEWHEYISSETCPVNRSSDTVMPLSQLKCSRVLCAYSCFTFPRCGKPYILTKASRQTGVERACNTVQNFLCVGPPGDNICMIASALFPLKV